jgi:signal transduction histidine kinase
LNPYGFMPHGFCYEWRPGVLWLHIVSDLSIALAYFGISFVLFYFVHKRRGLPFQLLFWLFSAFITLCGTTHLLSIWVLWHANYYVEGAVKALTAVVSLVTLGTLTFVLPRALSAAQSMQALIETSGKELADANAALRAQIAARETVESNLRQSQKMEAIGQLTGGIAHDFNNMLQAIGNSLELVQAGVTEGHASEGIQYIDTARQTVDRASALTSRLLSFARRQPLKPCPVNLDDRITSLQELLRTTVSTAGATVALELRLNDGGWPVLCDPNQLENAFLNITINARDAMPHGGKLTISTRQIVLSAANLSGQQDAVPGDYVEITIADTGIGMDEAMRLRVFEPFFTTKPSGQGTGLGLSQVYGFAHQSGGLVRLRSAPGRGTTVFLFLRRADAVVSPALTTPPMAPSTTAVATSQRAVLLVEDETAIREITAAHLRKLGYNILEASDGHAALTLYKRYPGLGLLVTDVGLPNGINGRQLADIIRVNTPELPILFITGYAGTTNLDQLDPGMWILAKPFTLPMLVAQVEALMGTPAGRVNAAPSGALA